LSIFSLKKQNNKKKLPEISCFLYLCKKNTVMGKGDIKSKRGKIHRGTHGKTRPVKSKKYVAVAEVKEEKKKATAKSKAKEVVAEVEEAAEVKEPKAKKTTAKAPAKSAKAKKEAAADQPDLFAEGEK
jgi:ribosomal small subunit protein bTHX